MSFCGYKRESVQQYSHGWKNETTGKKTGKEKMKGQKGRHKKQRRQRT